MEDYARAEPLCREAMEVTKRGHGEKQLAYAVSLDTLAKLYATIGDFDKAEPLCRQSHEIIKKCVGERHSLYATSLHNLAAICEGKGDYQQANGLYRQALSAEEQVLGTDHQNRAVTLDSLASEHARLGDYERALPLVREAMEVRRRVLGEQHPEYAVSINNLAHMYQNMGDHARAEPLYRKAMAILKETVGEKHLFYVTVLNNFAWEYESIGDERQAESLLSRSAETSLENLTLVADVLSERQQLAMTQHFRSQLDDYMSASFHLSQATEKAYTLVLRWKGVVFMRQRLARLARELPTLKPQLAELQQINRQLTLHAMGSPPSGQYVGWRREVERLLNRREDLERALSLGSEAYRKNRTSQQVTVSQIQSVLPPRAALIDILEYGCRTMSPRSSAQGTLERRVVAFVTRCDRPIRRVDLGPQAPIADAVERWRTDLAAKRPPQGKEDPAVRLRHLVWEPLENEIEGVDIILIAPDGALSQMPWAALPGRQADRYLLQDFTIAFVPVPQLLPQMLAKAELPATQGLSHTNMLLVGDVDFEASPVRPSASTVVARQAIPTSDSAATLRSARDGDRFVFGPLPGAAQEIHEIENAFLHAYPQSSPHLLEKGYATKQAFREQAGLYSYVHLATHGFFAPERMKPATAIADSLMRFVGVGTPTPDVTGWHPGLLSGLAFAGANSKDVPLQEDGILTALEVADLDLHKADMVVLSACDTGLGKIAGGEGLLGLQRAFQLSGARTVVASLWQVDDRVTRELMNRFYANLWQRRLQPADALRQAQLSLLDSSSPITIDRSISQPTGLPEGDRSVVQPGPHLWAAWVLSGYPGDLTLLGNKSDSLAASTDSRREVPSEKSPGYDAAGGPRSHIFRIVLFVLAPCVVILTVFWLLRKWRSKQRPKPRPLSQE